MIQRLIMILLFLCAGCSKPQTPVGKEYQLTEPAFPMEITLAFDQQGQFYGKAVNNYFGAYQIRGNTITLTPQGQTMMMGPLPQMEAEEQYLRSLRDIQRFIIKDKILILAGKQNYTLKELNTNQVDIH